MFQSSDEQPSACKVRQMYILEAELFTNLQRIRTTTYKNNYHEPLLQNFARELSGFGEAKQRWFPHQHLSIRAGGSGAHAYRVVALETGGFMPYLFHEVHHHNTSFLRARRSQWW